MDMGKARALDRDTEATMGSVRSADGKASGDPPDDLHADNLD
jgi:hypothetical protein